MELDQVWEIRLDLLLELVDECWDEKEEMSIAIKIERATRQKIWKEFEVRIELHVQIIVLILMCILYSEHFEGCIPVKPRIC